MKTKILFAILILFISIAVVFNPSKLKHQNTITKSILKEIGPKIKMTENELKIDTVFKKMIQRKNYFLFSTCSIKIEGKEVTISFGVLNFVIVKISNNKDLIEKTLGQIKINKLWVGSYNNYNLNQRNEILESLCYCCPGPMELILTTNNNDLFVTEKILPTSNSEVKKVNVNTFKVIDQNENYIVYEGSYPKVVFKGEAVEPKMKNVIYKIDQKLFIKDLYNSECENDSFEIVKIFK